MPQNTRPSLLGFRPDKEDRKILEWLAKRMGLKMTQVVKLAIRRLYETEKKSAG